MMMVKPSFGERIALTSSGTQPSGLRPGGSRLAILQINETGDVGYHFMKPKTPFEWLKG